MGAEIFGGPTRCTVPLRMLERAWAAPMVASIASRWVATERARSSAAAVGATPRAWRMNSGLPSISSSDAMWAEAAGWVMPSLCAARVSEPAR